MIIIQIKGGLGNQLFQYALGKRLAYDRDVPLKIDHSWYDSQTERVYRLNQFQIDTEIATEWEILRTTLKPRNFQIQKIYDIWQTQKEFKTRRFVSETKIGFDPNIIKLGKNVYLDGYWQSFRYFDHIAHIITNEFKLRYPLSNPAELILQEINSFEKSTVSVHIRRGDYLSNPHTNRTHGVLNWNYYQKALALLDSIIDNYHIFVFSDDPDWVQKNNTFDCLWTLVSGKGIPEFEELFLMSQCRHNIIANSSFSWWSAWLNSNPSKIVIAPTKWYKDPIYNNQTNDLIPEEWIRI